MKEFFAGEEAGLVDYFPPRGWYGVGGKKDVPKDACYVGRHGDCYVWVNPDGREALSEFTLTVMKLASLIKETQTLISPGSVKFSPGDRG